MRILASTAAAALLAISAPAFAQDTGTEISAPAGEGMLGGMFTGARDGSQPVVLIIPGSGPTDRDGNNPMGVRAATLRLLAEGLEQQGIASVRIDKRGMFSSASATTDPNAVTLADYAGDVLSWVSVIKAETGVPCVTIAGHSEGGLVALLAARAGGADVCGLMLLAAPGRQLRTTLEAQLGASPVFAGSMDQIRAMFDRIEKGETVPLAEMPAAVRGLLPPPVHPFLGNLFRTDPAEAAAAIPGTPMLLVYGEKDSQITLEDWHALRTARPDAHSLILPFATHALKDAAGDDPAAAAATYTDPDLPLTTGVAEAMASFVRLHAGS